MDSIKMMVNGLPGRMAGAVARHVLSDSRFELIPFSFTGPEISEAETRVADTVVRLVKPQDRDAALSRVKAVSPDFISVDYTHPSAVNPNGDFYCRNELPFVMGTTGGDRDRLEEAVLQSSTAAVIAPNMAKQIVGFQAMMEHAARLFPGLFEGYSLEIRESHQKGKADTSGTAKTMVKYFNDLGLPFVEADIRKERDPERQKNLWGIPEKFLTGHGWHTYILTSADGTVRFEFSHNVNGREIYARGTLDAIVYLRAKLQEGVRGEVFSMIDVLQRK
ncbi:MAG: dihydrodipicolinate reductase [Desulfobacterales bacterium]